MATHDYNLADASGLAFRSDLNSVLAAIISQNSAATAPTTTVAYMFWADTTTAILKQRNAGNSAWISLFNLTTGQWLGNAATVTVADAAADTTTWPMLARSQTGNQAPATDAGLTYDASTNTLTSAAFVGNLTGNLTGDQSGGTISATSVTSTGAITSSSPTAGIGYATGAGGSVTQLTSITTAVTLNKISGSVTTVSHSFVSGTQVAFALNNNNISLNDGVVITMRNSIPASVLQIRAIVSAGLASIVIYPTGSNIGALEFNFQIIKGVVS